MSYIGRNAAQAYLDDPRHQSHSVNTRYIMDDHFQRLHDNAVAVARECFLNMLADAKRFDEDVDGDEVNGSTVVYVDYHITTAEGQFRELVDALGIKVGWTETTKDAVDRAIAEPPALAIETGTAETRSGSVHESAGPQDKAQIAQPLDITESSHDHP